MPYTPAIAVLPSKHPGESIFAAVDFRLQLATGETLASVTSVTPDAGITVANQAVSGDSQVVMRISGGTSGEAYDIALVVLTSAGNTLVADLQITVTDPTP